MCERERERERVSVLEEGKIVYMYERVSIFSILDASHRRRLIEKDTRNIRTYNVYTIKYSLV